MKRIALIPLLGALALCAKALFTYLDPGSGSLIIQLLIALVVGILATFRFWKSRLLSIFGIREDSNEEDDEDMPIEN